MRFTLALLVIFSFVQSQELYIYAFGSPPRLIKKEIQSKSPNLNTNVLSYSKFKDFNKKLISRPNDIFISPALSLSNYVGIKIQYRSSTPKLETFHLLTLDPEITLQNTESLKLGSFNFLGKKQTKKFIQEQLKLSFKNIKMTNNLDDLQALLGLEVVNSLLLTGTQLKALQKQSKLSLHSIWKSPKQYDFTYSIATFSDRTFPPHLLPFLKHPVPSLSVQNWEAVP